MQRDKSGEGSMVEGTQITDVAPVYFAFDSDAVSSAERGKIRKAATFLKDNPSATVRLEGHADERGPADYNMVLSRRRSASVKVLLRSFGVSSDRIETVGYGEEFPAAEGHNENAWRQNRRVEFVFDAG
jgi:peptidoglycan-associated lipoprotein